MRRSVPWRRSILFRLLFAFAAVAVCSIAATAWLAVTTATVTIRQEQGQALADDARVYDTLVGYAATHPTWDGVGPTIVDLARQTSRHIVLTTQDHRRIADSATTDTTTTDAPSGPSTVVDPLAVDPALVPGTPTDRIDPRAVGPYLLPPGDRARLRSIAIQIVDCLRLRHGVAARIIDGPSGRPTVEGLEGGLTNSCVNSDFNRATGTEAAASAQLNALLNACLARQGVKNPNFTRSWAQPPSVSTGFDAQSWICLTIARREQLAAYVSPPSLVYVSSPGGTAAGGFDLSRANLYRIGGVSGLVLLLTVVAGALIGVRLIRPLRALTTVTERVAAGDITARVRVRGRDEVGRLAATFNDMSAGRQQLEQSRQVMVNDIAHELRTPVSNIRAWLEAVQDAVVTADGRWVASLLEEALLLQHIVDDLQDLAMADAGTLRLSRESVALTDLLAQVVLAHGAKADTAAVTLRVCVDGTPRLEADPVRLRQAVGNLVANALRHTPPGGSVTVAASTDHESVVITVADTGSGISADDLPHVFDRFWRAEKSRNRHTGGSGLGLAIVRKLAEAHGGTVTATSTPGQGSTFTLTFPLRPGLRSVQKTSTRRS
jgi:two-component system sensor histidine kinase BaeS